MTNDDYRDWDASYVLGALSADERREYEDHLATCESCRAAVAELAGMPGILGRLDAATALAIDEAPAAPAGAHHVTVGASRRLRRRRRVTALVGAAALVLVLAGGIGIGTALAPGSAAPTSAVAMAPVGRPVMSAQLSVQSVRWGTRLDWSCRYSGSASDDRQWDYALVVTTKDGAAHTVATWSGSSGDEAKGLSASTDIARSDIRSIDIRTVGSSTPLVRTTL